MRTFRAAPKEGAPVSDKGRAGAGAVAPWAVQALLARQPTDGHGPPVNWRVAAPVLAREPDDSDDEDDTGGGTATATQPATTATPPATPAPTPAATPAPTPAAAPGPAAATPVTAPKPGAGKQQPAKKPAPPASEQIAAHDIWKAAGMADLLGNPSEWTNQNMVNKVNQALGGNAQLRKPFFLKPIVASHIRPAVAAVQFPDPAKQRDDRLKEFANQLEYAAAAIGVFLAEKEKSDPNWSKLKSQQFKGQEETIGAQFAARYQGLHTEDTTAMQTYRAGATPPASASGGPASASGGPASASGGPASAAGSPAAASAPAASGIRPPDAPLTKDTAIAFVKANSTVNFGSDMAAMYHVRKHGPKELPPEELPADKPLVQAYMESARATVDQGTASAAPNGSPSPHARESWVVTFTRKPAGAAARPLAAQVFVNVWKDDTCTITLATYGVEKPPKPATGAAAAAAPATPAPAPATAAAPPPATPAPDAAPPPSWDALVGTHRRGRRGHRDVSWQFPGTSQELLDELQSDFRGAAESADHRSDAYLRRALASLVGLYGRGDLAQRDTAERCAAAAATAAPTLRGFLNALAGEAEDVADVDWYDLAMNRSGAQLLVDECEPAWSGPLVDRDALERLDEAMRAIAGEQDPLALDAIPAGVPDSHWWWTHAG